MYLSQLEFLRHMLDECAVILQAVKGKTQDEILTDAMLIRGLVRSLEIIGEAVKNLEDNFKSKYPHVDWRKMARMRDKLIHHYFGIDYDIVFSTIENDVPELHHELIRIIELETK